MNQLKQNTEVEKVDAFSNPVKNKKQNKMEKLSDSQQTKLKF